MRFTEFLIEAPTGLLPNGKPKRRLRPNIHGEYPPLKPEEMYVDPKFNLKNVINPRRRNKPAPVTNQPPAEQAPKPQQTNQPDLELGNNTTIPGQRQSDLFNNRTDPNVKPAEGNPKNPTPENTWANMVQAAGSDRETGRELMTLIGAMYQAKKRNPNVQMTMPKMVTSMEDGPMKARMEKVFNLVKTEGLPQLAARSAELQKSRSVVNKQAVNDQVPPAQQTPIKQPKAQKQPNAQKPQATPKPAPQQKPQQAQQQQPTAQNNQTMLQQIHGLMKNASKTDLQKVRDEAEFMLNKQNPEGNLPPKARGKLGKIPAAGKPAVMTAG